MPSTNVCVSSGRAAGRGPRRTAPTLGAISYGPLLEPLRGCWSHSSNGSNDEWLQRYSRQPSLDILFKKKYGSLDILFPGVLLGGLLAARDDLEKLVQQDHREREHHHRAPLVAVEVRNLEDLLQLRHREDQRVLRDRQADGDDEARVDPRRHLDERLVLRDGVERVEHLHHDEDREGDGLGLRRIHHVAPEAVGESLGNLRIAIQVVPQLVKCHLRPQEVVHLPPEEPGDAREAHVGPDHEVADQDPP
mmetsp:Transcript_33816/g.80059  ORF Transcript_33816/g.80059 Transcript_33816/m.80059 type:complete len:249 (-) Transcript_33816:2704-3450(-)